MKLDGQCVKSLLLMVEISLTKYSPISCASEDALS